MLPLEAFCDDCGRPMRLSEGTAVIHDGRVTQRCRLCVSRSVSQHFDDAEHARATVRLRALTRGPARPVLVSLVGAVCLVLAPSVATPIRDLAYDLLVDDDVVYAGTIERTAVFAVPAAEHRRIDPLTLSDDGEELTWIHPLAGPERQLPSSASRRFGAQRTGTRPECGAGHCGVDLGHERGVVVHAAADGFVARIVRDRDRKGGRYVKLEHPSGFRTYYMHLDRIRGDLRRGTFVPAGAPVGTVGRSGIQRSGPHLHFAVSREGLVRERFFDPEPMLRHAILLDEPAKLPWRTPPDALGVANVVPPE